MSSNYFSSQRIEKALQQGVKKVLHAQGIQPSTRAGNKELKLFLKPLTAVRFPSLNAARDVGETLGQKIAELSQQQGKSHLDRGVIRQLGIQEDVRAIAGITDDAAVAKATPQPVAKAPAAQVAGETAPAIATPTTDEAPESVDEDTQVVEPAEAEADADVAEEIAIAEVEEDDDDGPEVDEPVAEAEDDEVDEADEPVAEVEEDDDGPEVDEPVAEAEDDEEVDEADDDDAITEAIAVDMADPEVTEESEADDEEDEADQTIEAVKQ